MSRNALSTVLSELRVSGAIVLSQAHPIPWSIRVPEGSQLRGHFDLQPGTGKPIVVNANQLFMCANGQGHIMGSGEADHTRDFEEVMSDGSFESTPSETGHTEIVCGVFMLRNTPSQWRNDNKGRLGDADT